MKVLVKAPDYAEVLKWLDPAQRAVVETRVAAALLIGASLGGFFGCVAVGLVIFFG